MRHTGVARRPGGVVEEVGPDLTHTNLLEIARASRGVATMTISERHHKCRDALLSGPEGSERSLNLESHTCLCQRGKTLAGLH